MASIHISTYAAWSFLRTTLFNVGIVSPMGQSYGLAYRAGSYYGYFRILKGTVPTDFTFATDMLNYTRTADKLLEWNGDLSFAGSYPITLTNYTNLVTINLPLTAATGSGTASWFWWTAKKNESHAIGLQMLGTIGNVGSGLDIEIPDTNVVTGNSYRMQDVRWAMPSGFTY
jgi:hypothetical protein